MLRKYITSSNGKVMFNGNKFQPNNWQISPVNSSKHLAMHPIWNHCRMVMAFTSLWLKSHCVSICTIRRSSSLVSTSEFVCLSLWYFFKSQVDDRSHIHLSICFISPPSSLFKQEEQEKKWPTHTRSSKLYFLWPMMNRHTRRRGRHSMCFFIQIIKSIKWWWCLIYSCFTPALINN